MNTALHADALHADALHVYEVSIAGARQRLEDRAVLRELLAEGGEDGLFHAFLIQWASLSVQLHEPVEQYLAEASRRCALLGEHALALPLLHVAIDAIEFYRLLAEDTRSLARLWNQRRLPYLNMTSLLTQPPTPAIRRYHDFHRQVVSGADPWTELASVFEVQAMLGAVSERVLGHAARLLGQPAYAALRSLQSLAQHSHSSSLTTAMANFLGAKPERHERMLAVGTQTLDLYGEFLSECCVAGSNLASWPARQHAS